MIPIFHPAAEQELAAAMKIGEANRTSALLTPATESSLNCLRRVDNRRSLRQD
jgi:hypothetical protein